MKLSNLMIASLGAVALMGCDDGDKTPAPSVPDVPQTLAFEETYWDMGTVPFNALSTQALEGSLTDKFKFEDDKLRVYTFAQTGDNGDEFTYTETGYTAGDEEVDNTGTVKFTLDSVDYDCNYAVADDALNLDCNDGAVSFAGSEITDTDLLDDLDNNSKPEEGETFPTPVNEYSFENGALTDSGSAGDDLDESGSSTVTIANGVAGSSNAVDVDQSNGFGYLKYSADGSNGVNQITDSFTLEAVFNRDTVATYTNSDASLIEFANSSSSSNTSAGFKLSLGRPGETEKQAQFRIYGFDDADARVSKELTTATENDAYPIELDTWYHLTAVYSVSGETKSMKLYLNGELVNETNEIDFDPEINVNDTVSFMGGSTTDDKNIDGIVDNLAIWNVALTEEQIAERAAQFGFGEEETPPPAAGVTDNFDSYTAGTEISAANESYLSAGDDDTTAEISITQASSGSNSLYLSDGSASTKPTVAREFGSAAESGSVSVKVFIPTGNPKSSYLYLGNSKTGSSGDRFTEILFGSNVQFRNDAGDSVDLVAYDKETWVDVTVSWDGKNEDGQYPITVTIDGTEYTEIGGAAMLAQAADGAPTMVTMYVGDNSSTGTQAYFDDLDSELF